ncbi:CocE/NonD family hydrolase [Gemmatimonas sp.]|uniref:CocE/NonD family hydrolase n=1 Tax=Gemmatimonas sp. TaxID=1962908 RepID=UPI003565744D
MRVDDGVALAADVILPGERPAGRISTVLIQTRYWRSFRMRGGGGPSIPQGPREPIAARLVEAGYAVVIVDVRGTGASNGVWRWPWSADEVRDMGPVIDWIVAQPWSNGAVGATGVSYEGTTALLAAATGRPALKAVLARQIEWQLADETLAPGGVRNALFADTWGRAVDDLDHGKYPAIFPRMASWLVTGVGRRDDDLEGLAQREREQARPSSDVAQRAHAVTRGSDPFGVDAPATDSLGPAGHMAALANTRTVVGLWES